MKRILLVSPFPPYIGGVSVSVQRLHDFLKQSGYDVYKFDIHFTDKKFNRSRFLKFLRFLSLPLYLSGTRHFDVIHFHVSGVVPKLYISLWRFLFSLKTKFIITIHGQVMHTLNSMFGYLSLSGFDKIICVKKGDRQLMPPKLRIKTVEIPAFIPPVIFPEAKAPASLMFHDPNSFKILLNGFIIFNDRFNDLYGFLDAIKLLEQLRNRGRNAELALVVTGTGHDRSSMNHLRELKHECRARGLERFVCWIEDINSELWPVIKAVNVLLRPTKSDGDALSVREALFLKIPVIASNVVPRPDDTVIYDINSKDDLLNKTLSVMDNYGEYVSRIGKNNISFASKIVEQYEN